MTATSEVLYAAADLIEERGWYSINVGPPNPSGNPWGGGSGSTAPVCIEGAIAAAVGINLMVEGIVAAVDVVIDCPAYRAVETYLGMRPFIFNDFRAKSADEVVEVLRAAALIAAAKETAPSQVARVGGLGL